jgi:hypothetical protein
MREPLRIVVPVDGSAPATRAVAHALSVVAGQPGAEIFLVNVQNLRTLDISDISAVMTVEVDRPAASGTPIPDLAAQSDQPLPQSAGSLRDVYGDRLPGRDHRARQARGRRQSDRNGHARSWKPR